MASKKVQHSGQGSSTLQTDNRRNCDANSRMVKN